MHASYVHGLTPESGMQHTFISRELLLCQSGIGAAPIDKYLTSHSPRRRSSLLHVVPRCCGSSGRPFALQPQQVQSNTCSLPPGCVSGIHTALTVLRRAVLPGLAATSTRRSDRIRRRQPRPGNSRVSQGPWSTNAEEMTLWICSAARNEGKMAERVPRTRQGCDEDTGHTVCRSLEVLLTRGRSGTVGS